MTEEWEWRSWGLILKEEGFKLRQTPDGSEPITPLGVRIGSPDILVAARILSKRGRKSYAIANYNLWEELVDEMMEN